MDVMSPTIVADTRTSINVRPLLRLALFLRLFSLIVFDFISVSCSMKVLGGFWFLICSDRPVIPVARCGWAPVEAILIKLQVVFFVSLLFR